MKGKFFALSGLLYTALIIIGGFVLAGFPSSDITEAKISDFFAGHSQTQLVAGCYLVAASAFFIVLYGIEMSGIASTDRNPWSFVVMAGIILIAATSLLFAAFSYGETMAFYGTHLSANQMVSVNVFQQLIPMFANGAFGIYLLGSAGALWNLRRSMSYVALVIGILLFTPISWLALLLVVIWIVVMSIMRVMMDSKSQATFAQSARP